MCFLHHLTVVNDPLGQARITLAESKDNQRETKDLIKGQPIFNVFVALTSFSSSVESPSVADFDCSVI